MQKNTTASKSLQSIADQLGFSKNTVSLALRDSDRISDQTKALIKDAARKMQYIPPRRSGLIGIYTQTLADPVRTELVNSLLAELRFANYHPILGLGQDHYGPWYTSPWAKAFVKLNVEAMVVVNETLIKRTLHMPTILVACHPNDSLQCDYVAIDRSDAARTGIEYLLSRGHKKIIIGSDSASPFGQGCIRTLENADMQPNFVSISENMTDDQIRICADKVLKSMRKGVTAILFCDSPVAARVSSHLLTLGVHIPDDVSIIGYDYFPWASMLSVPLTTIEQPIMKLANRGIELTKQRLLNHDTPFVHEILPHRLIIRKSTT